MVKNFVIVGGNITVRGNQNRKGVIRKVKKPRRL